jgi:hypothetical protein
MFLSINGKIHSVSKRIVKGKTIKYLSVTPAVEEIAGKIQMFRDDGFLLSEDNADNYARKTYVGTLLQISNDPEPVPVTPQPTVEQRVAALENAIKEGLSL